MKTKYNKPAIEAYEMEIENMIAGSGGAIPGANDKNPGSIGMKSLGTPVWYFGGGNSDHYNDSRASRPYYDDEEL